MQELKVKLKRLIPDGPQQVHFSSDFHTGTNLSLDNKKSKEVKEERKAKTNPSTAVSKAKLYKAHAKADEEPGDIIYLRSVRDKHGQGPPSGHGGG